MQYRHREYTREHPRPDQPSHRGHARQFERVDLLAHAHRREFRAESATGSTTYLKYNTAALRELVLQDVIPAALKTLAFGFVVGAVGCYIGMNPRDGAEGVGRAATDSVVACSLLVLVADVLLVLVIKAMQALM
jgi:hypothetical protein